MSTIPPEIAEVMAQAHEIYTNGLRDQMLKPDQQDWVYRDIPWTTVDMWVLLIDAIGEPNIRMVSGSERTGKDGVAARRASVFISPTGIENLTAWAKAQAAHPNPAQQESES